LSEKMRVHILAKELNVTSKAILLKCRAEGLDSVVKNHMSTLSAGLYATIREWFSDGDHGNTVETSARVDLKKVRTKRKKAPAKAKPQPATATDVEVKSEELVVASSAPAEAPAISVPIKEEVADVAEVATGAPAVLEPEAKGEAAPVEIAGEGETVDGPPEAADELVEQAVPGKEAAAASVEGPAAADEVTQGIADDILSDSEQVAQVVGEVPTVLPADQTPADTAQETATPETQEQAAQAEDLVTAGPQNVPQPYKLKGPRVVRYEAPDPIPVRRPPRAPRPVEGPGAPPAPATVPGKPPPRQGGQPGRPGEGATGRGKGRINPRRSVGRLNESGERLKEWRDKDLVERQERLAGATGRRIHRRRSTPSAQQTVDQGPKTSATVHEPIRMKEFCAETGLNFIQCFKILKEEHGILSNINMILPTDTAQLLALEIGIDLEVIAARTLLDGLQEEFQKLEQKHSAPRPPVVTMLGHVDHGKTSLLDAIRETRVVDTEDGGITQHLGAYNLHTKRGTVTFLDTPGHEAFTAMRARGTQVTDVVVLVVAADDGVMPQTIEAINHAKNAEVPIVVALNKIDLGDQNVLKIYGQLAEHGLTPSGDWGGEVDVIPTSATTGAGIEDLVEHLASLTELLDLRADHTLPACGAVLESETKTGVGAVARILVQQGTLKVGDVVSCGNAFGKVRVLVDDQGRRLKEAGPSMPVEVWGLDDVPCSGDKLYRVENLQRAKSIAAEVKQARVSSGRLLSRKVNTLEEMFQLRAGDEIPELNIIIKADVDGSVEMLKQTLAKIPSEEVKLTIRHAGVGTINDSDVLLAAACKGIVVAYRVETSTEVHRLADREGVDVRSYRVVYDVSDDIKKALEGLLAPEEHIEMRATVTVKNVFRISKVGLVSGCLVTDGTVNRNHLAKVLRDGVVVRDGCKIESLRRFKDDAKEVRSGMECGIRLKGFDDVHEGDTLEMYEVVKTARTL